MRVVTDWLLLRGLSREKRQWGGFEAVLAGRGVAVHRLDLPGVGEAKARPAPALVELMVEDLRDRLRPTRAAGAGGAWGLLGVSLGGMVALEWTYRYPQDFKAAVVVNSSAGNLNPPQERLLLQNLPALLRAGRARDPVQRELILLAISTAKHGEDRRTASEWAEYLAEHPLDRRVLIRQLVAGLRFRAPPALGVPTLFVGGAKDTFVSPRCSERLAERYGVPLQIHPEAGHDLPVDEPEWLADRAIGFAEELR